MSKSKFAGILPAAPAATDTPRAARPRGRPHAKRSDPAYVQVTAYMRRDTLQAAKMKLLKEKLKNEGHGRDFSELMEDLAAAWAKARD